MTFKCTHCLNWTNDNGWQRDPLVSPPMSPPNLSQIRSSSTSSSTNNHDYDALAAADLCARLETAKDRFRELRDAKESTAATARQIQLLEYTLRERQEAENAGLRAFQSPSLTGPHLWRTRSFSDERPPTPSVLREQLAAQEAALGRSAVNFPRSPRPKEKPSNTLEVPPMHREDLAPDPEIFDIKVVELSRGVHEIKGTVKGATEAQLREYAEGKRDSWFAKGLTDAIDYHMRRLLIVDPDWKEDPGNLSEDGRLITVKEFSYQEKGTDSPDKLKAGSL